MPGKGRTRRDFLRDSAQGILSYVLLRAAWGSAAISPKIKPDLERWLKGLYQLCGDLRKKRLTPLEWQDAMERLCVGIQLRDLVGLIDVERLLAGVNLPENRAAVRDVRFPELEGLPPRRGFSHKVFALKRGAAIAPHAHNDMVSAHLVLAGSFHVRTFNRHFRLETEPGFLTVEPSLDARFEAGRVLTMSDVRDNVHWLVAESERAFTFDVPVVGLNPEKPYPTPANRYNMIYIDPLGENAGGSLIRAKVLDFETAMTRYGSVSSMRAHSR